MKTRTVFTMLLAGAVVFLFACGRSGTGEAEKFSSLALQGKQVFENKDCARCHDPAVAHPDSLAPDLSRPFLANDSMFVRTHLKYVEQTQMPRMALTATEIRLLSYYVSELHRAKHPSVSEADADARCPVCYAPVSAEDAKAEKLHSTYLGNEYYFECAECRDAFKRAPEAFLELYRIYLTDIGEGAAALQ